MTKANGKGKPENIARKEIEGLGLTFDLPAVLPLSVAFDLAGIGGPFADLRFLNSVLGDEQMVTLRAKLDEGDYEMSPEGSKVLGTLIEDILSAYGFETGESTASATS